MIEPKIAMQSGGPIESFAGGWALIPFAGEKAHQWQRATNAVIDHRGQRTLWASMCGVMGITGGGINALEPGDFSKCKNCMRATRQ